MDDLKFWALVQRAHADSGGDMDQKCEAITEALSQLSAEEALAFSRLFDAARDRAYTWPLWGAAYIINGGCSDDSFSDFRSALISRGHEAFEKALADPDSLADEDYDEDAWFYESYHYAVMDGVEAAIGSAPQRDGKHPEEPSGDAWDEDDADALRARFPRLSEKFA